MWLPEKLARGVEALDGVAAGTPALYCARQSLVNAALRPIRLSARVTDPPGFPQALTQNIATGCTVMLNADAVRLIAGAREPPDTLHDWWAYLVVTAAGGRVLIDDEPTVLYRQHAGNAVGVPALALAPGGGGDQARPGRVHAHLPPACRRAAHPAGNPDPRGTRGAGDDLARPERRLAAPLARAASS